MPATRSGPGHGGDDADKTKPDYRTTDAAATLSPDCNCSTKAIPIISESLMAEARSLHQNPEDASNPQPDVKNGQWIRFGDNTDYGV